LTSSRNARRSGPAIPDRQPLAECPPGERDHAAGSCADPGGGVRRERASDENRYGGLSHTRASLTIARKLARRSYHVLNALGPAALEPIQTT
jgi:hypothetical protein